MIKKITNEILIPTGVFILLLLGMVYFPYIPLKLFNIDINKFSPSMKILYSFCTDIGYMIILFFLYKETLIDNFKKFTKIRERIESIDVITAKDASSLFGALIWTDLGVYQLNKDEEKNSISSSLLLGNNISYPST